MFCILPRKPARGGKASLACFDSSYGTLRAAVVASCLNGAVLPLAERTWNSIRGFFVLPGTTLRLWRCLLHVRGLVRREVSEVSPRVWRKFAVRESNLATLLVLV